MSKKIKKPPKTKKPGTERGLDAGSLSDRRSTVSSDMEQPEQHRDPRDGTAAIPPVTEAMMDHAAHEAAALADGVAHATVAATEAGQAAGTDVAARAAAVAGDAAAAAADAAQPAHDAVQPALDAARDAMETAAGAAERAAEASAPASADALGQYNAKVMEVLRVNVAATSAHLAALVQTKSIPEAVSLNADHLRRQIETLTSQGRELSTLAQQAAFEMFRPFRDAMKRGR